MSDFSHETDKPLTRNIQAGREPLDRAGYEKAGGYRALRKALGEMSPDDVLEEVKDSNLRGRGGAGFPTGVKWSFVPRGEDAPKQKYLIANADEMEPGTFKDRLLLEGDPHQLLEAMVISGYAIEASEGYIFLRWAYREAARLLEKALAEAREAGYLGPDIQGSGYSFDVHLHVSAGRYMCGEETGLLNALEGKRATPRSKPPYPQVSGLWGKPTIVQNVETLVNVPHVIERGAEGYRALAREGTEDGGTKIVGVSGKVKRPGCWEVPMGTPLREVLEDLAGGMREGHTFKGLLPGGASTDFLVAEHLDTPLDFDSIEEAGSRLGTGTLVVLDGETCPIGMCVSLERFFARESCGWCTPCRDGLPWVENLLVGLEEGRGRMEDLDTLAFHGKHLGPGNTYCALAPGAMEPLQSALQHFRDDFEAHVRQGGCTYRQGRNAEGGT